MNSEDIPDLVYIIELLVYEVRKTDFDNPLARAAMDYINGNEVLGEPRRVDSDE